MGKHKKKHRDDPEANSKETEAEVHMIVQNGKHNLSTEVDGTAKEVSIETFTKKKKKKKDKERESKPANSCDTDNVLSDSALEPNSSVTVNCEEEKTSPKKKKKKKKAKMSTQMKENNEVLTGLQRKFMFLEDKIGKLGPSPEQEPNLSRVQQLESQLSEIKSQLDNGLKFYQGQISAIITSVQKIQKKLEM